MIQVIERNETLTIGAFQFIAFFTESKEREERENSEHGATLALPNPWRPIKLHAELSTQELGETEFVHRLTTETIEGESSPKFTTRATFGAMTMIDSQNKAKRTVVKLARLLWDTCITKTVEPVIPSMVVVKNRKAAQGRIFVEVVRGRPLSSPPDNQYVALNLGISPRLWAMISEQRVYVALCCVGFRGRWNRVYASEHIKKPFMRKTSTIFPRIYLSRSVLISDNPNNPIRIELYGCRKAYPKLLGYCHVTFMDLEKTRDIVWNTGSSSALLAVMKVTSALGSQNRSEVDFCLEEGTPTRREIHANSGKECFIRVDQDEKTLGDVVHFSTAPENANFHQRYMDKVSGKKESVFRTPQNLKVHFPGTCQGYSSVLK
ncbi:hypothetical protein FGB62_68g147 [Gracilaria domingensis]|nr:hypothetical protein FGB62_68g147 [Gracilaria domingensis]